METHINDAYRKDSTKKVHQAMRESIAGFSAEIIFHGSEEQCYAVEKILRPEADMGLNTAPGGSEADLTGVVPNQNIYKVKNVRHAKP